jgi:DNA invertase Pin-like site-specific DNA recombinase
MPPTTNGKQLRAAGYCRTSGEGQRDNTSIPRQREAVTAFCKGQGWALYHIYADECRSGAKVDGRGDFQQMLRDATAGKFDLVVPFDATRLARDGVDVVSTAKTLKATFGIHVVDAKGQFDNRDHRNALRNFVQAGVSEHERLSIMERTLGGRVAKAQADLPWAGNPPFGREWVKSCGCDRKCKCGQGRWQVSERGRSLVALLKRYVAGEPLRALAEAAGFYGPTHVFNIIRQAQLAARPFVVTFNTPEIGIDKLAVPVPGLPPVISSDLERRVRDRLSHNRNWARQELRKYILGGFIRCGCCKAALSGGTVRAGNGKERRENVYYFHHRHTGHGGKACPFQRVPGALVEGPVLDYLYKLFVDQPSFDAAVRLALPTDGQRARLAEDAKRAEADLARCEKEIANLVNAVAAGADPSLLTARQGELRQRRQQLTDRLTGLQAELSGLPDPEAVQAEADVLRCMLAQEHAGKDWRKEEWQDVRRFLHFLFGDNPKREGLGLFIDKKGGRFTVDIKARLRLREPYEYVMSEGIDGFAHMVGAVDGEEVTSVDLPGARLDLSTTPTSPTARTPTCTTTPRA